MTTNVCATGDEFMTSTAKVERRRKQIAKGHETILLDPIATDAPCVVTEKFGNMRTREGAQALVYDVEVFFDPPVDIAPNATNDSEDIITITGGQHSGAVYRCVHAIRTDWSTSAKSRRHAKPSGHVERTA